MINFLKYRFVYLFFSLCIIGMGIFSVVRWGFIYSIDFVGGTNAGYELSSPLTADDVTLVFEAQEMRPKTLTVTGNTIEFRTDALDEEKESALKAALEEQSGGTLTVLTSETVGPTLGRETLVNTLIASTLSVIVILIYMSFAFRSVLFAASAIVALLHDLLVVFGIYSLLSHFFGAQVDTMFVTAVLISMTFSVHDTIVIFDKVREYMKHEPGLPFDQMINKALTETMVRSINNSTINIVMLVALIVLGGEIIRFFLIALLIGTLTGTYSSPFVASPVLSLLSRRRKK